MANFFDKYDDQPPSGAPQTASGQPAPEGFSWRNLGRNIAAGLVEGGTAIANVATDPFGTVIGPTVGRVAGTLYDAGANAFGYTPLTPEQRADLSGATTDSAQQPLATRAVNAAGSAIGASPEDVQATTPAEQIARKVATGAVAGGAGGPGAALVGAGGAAVGDVASRAVPDWAAPGVEVAGNVAGGALTSKAVSPTRTVTSPQRQALVAAATDEGIPLSAAERTGSKTLAKAEQMLPGGETQQGETQAGFNRAALRRAGIDSDIATPDVLRDAERTIGGRIGEIANRNTLDINQPQLGQRLVEIEDSLRFLSPEVRGRVQARLDQLRDAIVWRPDGTPGHVPGASYRMLDSQLGRTIRSTTDGDTRAALGDLRETLRTAMDNSISDTDREAWALARRQYANLKVIRDAASGAGAAVAEGNISPLALRTAVDRGTGGGYEMGRGDLNQLARIGQSVLRKPSDSGSPAGIRINSLLGGTLAGGGAGLGYYFGGGPVAGAIGAAAPFVAPTVAGAAMRGRIPFTNYSPGQAYLSNQLARQVNPLVVGAITAAAEEEDRRRRQQPGP